MTTANENTALDFVADFLDVYDTHGILDKFDTQTQKMQTSSHVYALVQEARRLMPHKAKDGAEAQKLNQKLTQEQIVKQVESSPKVINAQERFAKRTAAAGGAQGLLSQFAEALRTGDSVKVGELGRHIVELDNAIKTGEVPNEEV